MRQETNRRQFLAMTLALTGAGALVLTGCGGGSGSVVSGGGAGGGGNTGDGFGRGAVGGAIFVDAAGALVLVDPAAPPAGAAVASGATVEVVGENVSGNVAADGTFKLTSLRAGIRTLRIQHNGTTKDIPLTVIADAAISLKPTPISRDQAISAAKGAVPADALVCAPQHPLPAGVVLRSAENTVEGATVGTTLTSPQWFVYIDSMPGSRFGHPTQFVLIDAQTGAVTTQDQQCWPTLNGGQFYANAGFSYAPVTPDVIQPGGAASFPALASSSALRSTRAHVGEIGTTRGVLAAGWPRYDMVADVFHMPALLGHGGIPAGTPTGLLVPNSAKTHLLGVWSDACLQATEGDTVLFYLSSHGMKAGYALLATHFVAPPETPAADIYRTQDDGTTLLTEHLLPADLLPALQNCLACDVIIMIDTCYSGVWASYYSTVTLPRPAMSVTVLTAADADHISIGKNLQPASHSDPPPPGSGAVYTNAFLDAFRQLAAGGGDVSLSQAHSQTVAALSGSADPEIRAQNPQISSHTPPAGVDCGVTFDNLAASVIPKDLTTFDFTVMVDSKKPAEGAFSYQFTTAGTQGTLVSATSGSGINIQSEHPIIGYLAKIDATEGATETISVKVYTRESTPRLVGSSHAVVTIQTKGDGNLFPIHIGYTTTHDVSYTDPDTGKTSTGTLYSFCSSTGTFNGVPGLFKWETPGLLNKTQFDAEYYSVAGDISTSYGTEITFVPDNGTTITEVYTPPAQGYAVLASLQVGDSRTYSETTVSSSSIPPSNTVTNTLTRLPDETITVPAGTFACRKFAGDISDPTSDTQQATVRGTIWFAPGVGFIKAIYAGTTNGYSLRSAVVHGVKYPIG